MSAPAARFELQRHFVGGAFRDSAGGGTFETLDPATDEVLAEVCDGRAADVDAAVGAARRGLRRGAVAAAEGSRARAPCFAGSQG